MGKFDEIRDAVILDVETTGLKASKDRIISIALIKTNLDAVSLDNQGRTTIKSENEYYIFDPQMKIPEAASKVNGFKNENLKGRPLFLEKAEEIRDFIGDSSLIAHNMKFDGAFLDNEFERAGVDPLTVNKRYCTMMEAHRRASEIHGRRVKWPKLTEAGQYAGVKIAQSKVHDAMEDAQNALKLAVGFRYTEVQGKGLVNRFSRSTTEKPTTKAFKATIATVVQVLLASILVAFLLVVMFG